MIASAPHGKLVMGAVGVSVPLRGYAKILPPQGRGKEYWADLRVSGDSKIAADNSGSFKRSADCKGALDGASGKHLREAVSEMFECASTRSIQNETVVSSIDRPEYCKRLAKDYVDR